MTLPCLRALAQLHLRDQRHRQHALCQPRGQRRRRGEQVLLLILDEALENINGAIAKAAEKNLKNVLVLSNDAAFIVSVDNHVVVTAMNGEDMRENVITNIDGTVII